MNAKQLSNNAISLKVLVSEGTYPLHNDDLGLGEELKKMDILCEPTVWTEYTPQVDDHVLIRTPWDYTNHHKQFLQLIESLESKNCRVINSASTLKWNLDKTYLLELQNLNFPVPLTEVVNGFEPDSHRKTSGNWVYKPAIGASGIDTFLCESSSPPNDLHSLRGRKVLIQEFVPEILTSGEVSMMFFGGCFSHAVVKTPKSGEFRIQEEHGGTTKSFDPSRDLLKTALELVNRLPVKQSYCRLDLVITPKGPLVMEVELIEPCMYFRSTNKSALNLFCKTIVAALKH